MVVTSPAQWRTTETQKTNGSGTSGFSALSKRTELPSQKTKWNEIIMHNQHFNSYLTTPNYNMKHSSYCVVSLHVPTNAFNTSVLFQTQTVNNFVIIMRTRCRYWYNYMRSLIYFFFWGIKAPNMKLFPNSRTYINTINTKGLLRQVLKG